MNETASAKEMSAAQTLVTEVAIVVVVTAVSAVTFFAVQSAATFIAHKAENRRFKKSQSKKH